MSKVLFILRKRSSYGVSFGLVNSCKLVAQSLEKNGFECKIVEVIDSHGIDKEIYDFKPDFVICEALWVEATKFPILFKLHPNVKKWSVRIHSRAPFLSNEAMALVYIKQYQAIAKQYKNFNVSANHQEMVNELEHSLGLKADYLPNIYPFNDYPSHFDKDDSNTINISSFGSIRPQKNILIQAIAAIGFADKIGKTLNFHINSDRSELNGINTLKNLENLFKDSKHRLIEHSWLSHGNFCRLVSDMDICMGVSNTETFCITIADAIINNVPVVTSDVIDIVSPLFHCDPNKTGSIIDRLNYVWLNRRHNIQDVNKEVLKFHNRTALKDWLEYLK